MSRVSSFLSVLLTSTIVLAAATPTVSRAQSAPSGGGARGDSTETVVFDFLTNGGVAVFDSNGQFGFTRSGAQTGASVSRGRGVFPTPPGPPGPSIGVQDLQALENLLTQTRAARCLVSADTAPCAPADAPPTAMNVVSTEVNITWLVNQVAEAALRDAPLPDVAIQVNPTRGLSQMDSWFWVDRSSYGGQAFTYAASIPSPWTLTWDTVVHHHDAVNGPCPDDPSQQCAVGSNDWDETLSHREDHLDVVDLTLTFTPAQYVWGFGDDHDGPARPESHAVFLDAAGLGLPYTDAFHASSVVHRYHESSLKVFDQGGFPVHLEVRWGAVGTVRATRDGAVVQNDTLSVGSRVGEYEARYQVRESQPIVRSSAP